MVMIKNDPAYAVKGRQPKLDVKGFPMGGSPESDNDMGFNGQTPPGEYIENQMLSEDAKRVAKMKVSSASTLLASESK